MRSVNWKLWQGEIYALCIVADILFIFLTFAQFGFLDIASGHYPGQNQLDPLMAAMGLSGLATSIITGIYFPKTKLLGWMKNGFAVLTAIILFCWLPLPYPGFVMLAAGLGISLGVLTIALAVSLRDLLRARHFGLKIGFATGLAYFMANLPFIFEGSDNTKIGVTLLASLGGIVLCHCLRAGPVHTPQEPFQLLPARFYTPAGFLPVLLAFFALIWLDSGVFYIIQQNQVLKDATWGSPWQKLSMGTFHWIAALCGGWLIDRKMGHLLIPLTYCLFFYAFTNIYTVRAAVNTVGLCYASGISLYSVLLGAFACLYPPTPQSLPMPLRAGLLYGISGWMGTALGIGLAKQYQHIPHTFLVFSGLLLLLALLLHQKREPWFFQKKTSCYSQA